MSANNDDTFPEELELLQEPKAAAAGAAAAGAAAVAESDTKTEGRRRRRRRSRSQSPSENSHSHSHSGSGSHSGSSHSSDQDESDEEDENNLFDLMTDFFVNENGDNVATILTNIQGSLDQHAKCILKLTKVLQDFAASQQRRS